MGQFEDVLKAGQELAQQAAPAVTSFEDILAAGQQLEQPPAPELTEPARPVGPEEQAAISAPTDPKELGKLRLAAELGGGITATIGTGGAAAPLTIGRLGLLSLQAGAGEAAGSILAETFDPSESLIARAFQAFKTGAIGEAIGGTIFRIGGKIFGGTKLVEGAETAIRQIMAKGGVITPGLASKSWAVDLLETVTSGAFLGGSRIRATRETAEEIATRALDDFADTFAEGATREDVGALINTFIEGGDDAFRAAGKDLADGLTKLVSGATVDGRGLHKLATTIKKEAATGVRTGAIVDLADDVLSKKEFMSFSDAQQLRSSLLAIGRKPLADPGATAAAKRMSGTIDEAMETSAKQLTGKAFDAWRGFNTFWKNGNETFSNGVIQRLSKLLPEAVFQTAVRAKRPGTIRLVRKAVGNEQAWQNVQGQLVRELLTHPTKGTASGVSGRLARFGDEALDAALSPEQRKTFKELARTLDITEGKAAIGEAGTGGGMLIQLTQGGAIAALLSSGAGAPKAAAVVAIPWGLSHLITRKSVAKLLTIGLKAPVGSQEATRAFGQLSAIMSREMLKLGEQERQSRQPRQEPPRTATFGGPQLPLSR